MKIPSNYPVFATWSCYDGSLALFTSVNQCSFLIPGSNNHYKVGENLNSVYIGESGWHEVPIDNIIKYFCYPTVINTGDTVQLKTGSPSMSVTSIRKCCCDDKEMIARCVWFVNDAMKFVEVNIKTLKKV